MMFIRANQLNSSGNVNLTLAALKRASKLQQLLVCMDSVPWMEQGCSGLCAVLSAHAAWSCCFPWPYGRVNQGFVPQDDRGDKPLLSLASRFYLMLLIYPLKLYSPVVVLDSCSCSDISVYYLNPVWLFKNQEGIASTLVKTVVGRKADTANSSRLCAPVVIACVGQVLYNCCSAPWCKNQLHAFASRGWVCWVRDYGS